MPNNRIYWAIKALGVAPAGTTSYTAVKGVQSVGMSLDFSLTQAFELGQSTPYQNVENIPEVQCTAERLLDTTPLLYHLCTQGAPTGTLQGRANQRCNVAVSLFGDTNASASGAQVAEVTMSGMYLSSVSFNFIVDGFFTESITLVGNNRTWKTSGFVFTGGFLNTDNPVASGGAQRRQNFIWDTNTAAVDSNGQVNTITASILPPVVAGISSSGTNNRDSFGNFNCAVQSISVGVDLGRDAIYELGQKGPYFRYVNFPVEVSTEITVISKSGDNVSGTELGILSGTNAGNNLTNNTIKLYTQEGTFINTGVNNKLSNVSENGADTGGGNETLTYKFTTFDDFLVTHPQNPST